VLENRTLFEGIHVLPGASSWTFRRGTVEAKRSYFEPREWEEQPLLDEGPYYRQLRETFARNLPRYFDGPEPVGVSLTGGLDTRMIMAWRRPPPGSQPCYTFGGTFRDCRDVVVARRVARACRQPHEVISVGHEFLSRFPYYAERAVYLTDGCVDVSRSPYLDNDLVRTVFRAPASVLTNNDVCLRLIAEGDPVLRQIRTDRGIGATGVSAAASRALLEFLFKAEYAYDYGMPQWVARIDHV